MTFGRSSTTRSTSLIATSATRSTMEERRIADNATRSTSFLPQSLCVKVAEDVPSMVSSTLPSSVVIAALLPLGSALDTPTFASPVTAVLGSCTALRTTTVSSPLLFLAKVLVLAPLTESTLPTAKSSRLVDVVSVKTRRIKKDSLLLLPLLPLHPQTLIPLLLPPLLVMVLRSFQSTILVTSWALFPNQRSTSLLNSTLCPDHTSTLLLSLKSISPRSLLRSTSPLQCSTLSPTSDSAITTEGE